MTHATESTLNTSLHQKSQSVTYRNFLQEHLPFARVKPVLISTLASQLSIDAVAETPQHLQPERAPSHRDKYQIFLSKLPTTLQKIELYNDYSQVGPNYTRHKRNLTKFNSLCNTPELERLHRSVFLDTQQSWTKEQSRNTYMGLKLNHLGLGPGDSLENADYIQRLNNAHAQKVSAHCSMRPTIKRLSMIQQELLERASRDTMRLVERKAKTGDNISTLQKERKRTDQILAQSAEFNLRITEPAKWMEMNKPRQINEQENLTVMRAEDKDTLIMTREARLKYQLCDTKKLPLFDQNKLIASQIHRAVSTSVEQEQKVPTQISQRSSVSSLLYSEESPKSVNWPVVPDFESPQVNHTSLDARNKKLRHKTRLTNLKKKQAYFNKAKPVTHKHLMDSLNANHDPFIASKFRAFRIALANSKKPSFLLRMAHDSNLRVFLSKFKSSKDMMDLVAQYGDQTLQNTQQLLNNLKQPLKPVKKEPSLRRIDLLIEKQLSDDAESLSPQKQISKMLGKRLANIVIQTVQEVSPQRGRKSSKDQSP